MRLYAGHAAAHNIEFIITIEMPHMAWTNRLPCNDPRRIAFKDNPSRVEVSAMIEGHRRTSFMWPFVIALLTPLIAAVLALILLGLLGVFVVWLCIVAAILLAILITDGVRGSLRRLAPALLTTLQPPAVGAPGRRD